VSALYDRLTRYDAEAWQRAVDTLASEIHPIDRNATRIWFAFYPLHLHLALEAAPDPAEAARRLGLMGQWRLTEQIDSSHRFFFAHRYWPQVRTAVVHFDGPMPEPLAALVSAIADQAARTARVDREFLLGIAAAALMTLRQTGAEAFAAATGTVHLSDAVRARSPHQVMKLREKNDWQGLFGFTRGIMKRWTVTFDENDPSARFTAIDGQELTTAAQADRRDYHAVDERCTPNEGPIPVECRAASCGTCWVGVLAGSDKLSPVVERDEGRRMKVFGYVDTEEARPLVRLACQTRAHGAVTLVIPPWNGMFGSLTSPKR
jgi:ferredoxin